MPNHASDPDVAADRLREQILDGVDDRGDRLVLSEEAHGPGMVPQ
jgi:hypothetical protein